MRRNVRFRDPLLAGASWLPIPPDPGSSFSFRHLRMPRFPFPFHYHPEMEFAFIAKGTGKRVVGEIVAPFKPGDLVLVGSMLPHAWLSDSDSEPVDAYIIRFDGAALRRRLAELPEATPALQLLRQAERGIQWKSGACAAPEFRRMDEAASPAARLVAFLGFLFAISEHRERREICGKFGAGVIRGTSEQRIGFAFRYMLENSAAELTQGFLAGRLGMSPAAFSRLFHRVAGETFQDTLGRLRIEHACRLLAGTELSVTEICFASGFRNLSNFNKQFRAIKSASPRDFRREAATTQ